ncbi:MAG: hypothetical protein ACRCT8_04970 [Lacipirellulaceae bacterium]
MAHDRDLVLESDGVRIVFRWEDDRFTHEVCGSRHGADLVETTVEGMETPVFTDSQPQAGVLFLSGQSGDRHWSLSVEAVPGGLALDVACRAKSPCARLGSAYEALHERVLVTPEPAGKRPAATLTQVAPKGTIPRATLIEAQPITEAPATSRWRYRLTKR